jgi:uncharacterized protein (DUF1330 family)
MALGHVAIWTVKEHSTMTYAPSTQEQAMSAYVIPDVEILNPDLIRHYRALAQESTMQYGGRYLARGGTIDAVEGGWAPKNIVIVEFPSMAQARAWYRSPEYAAALKIRQHALDRKLIFVDGVPQPEA